ncbi:MAG: GyrI-like domain-containing protein [Planctomycetes bacterium]|nr:GyrI-like domain-containing protein [Planctomycetota bacterium]
MIDPPQIVNTEERLTAVIRLCVPASEIRQVMMPGLQELMAAVAAQGVAKTGPWFTHHFKVPDHEFDFELGVPVASAVKPTGRVTMSTLPATRVARTIYRGPYEELPNGWREFSAWVDQQGHRQGAGCWEYYAVGPESGLDPSQWQTELNRPLVD